MKKYIKGYEDETKEGYKIKIVDDCIEGSKKVKIRFINCKYNYEKVVFVEQIRRKNIKNPYHPTVLGVGFLGVGSYSSTIESKKTIEYQTWMDMMKRCYCQRTKEKYKSYDNVIVAEEWHNFQNFAEWYNNNFPKIKGFKFHLDKDLTQLDIENKIYSSNTCIFLPETINYFLTNKKINKKNDLPTGVTKISPNRFHAKIKEFSTGIDIKLGGFNSIEDASKAYSEARKLQVVKAKQFLKSLGYLDEKYVNLIK